MGGLGSGNGYRWQERKSTVEESLDVGMRNFRDRMFQGAAGTLYWTNSRSGRQSSIGYYVTWGDEPIVTLHYRWRDSEEVRIPVLLQSTPTQFGGKRWWFTCPLIVGGLECERRVGKLFLPPGAKYFGCRKCHDLTYRSSQEAHQTERLFGRLGFATDVAKMWDRMHK